jgi:hypothetical protein
MTEIKTWHERCMEHPDHQTGMVSEGMLRARMCEEIEELRAEIERLRARVEVLERVREAALSHLFEPSMASGTKLLKALQEAKP